MSTALRFSKIEPAQRAQLIAQIRSILTEVGAHNVDVYDRNYWNWQYEQLPTGKSLVYVAWDGDKVIGYYHVPIYRFSFNGREKLIGNIQDVAVDPNYRGMGLFRQLAEFANSDLDNSVVDLIYTFPNNKSIHTFLKYNDFKVVSSVPAYVRPVRSAAIIRSKIRLFGLEKPAGSLADLLVNIFSKSISIKDAAIEPIAEITDEVAAVFAAYSADFQNHLLRDKLWLDWRYLRSPRGKHHILALREEGKLTAAVVLKEDEMLGNPALLIMDFAHLTEKENSLLRLIDQVRKQPELIPFKFNLLFISGLAPALSSLGKIGFMRIPEKMNPRVLNLLCRNAGKAQTESLHNKNNWLLTLGDWDVF